jgi:hypothetical protein
MLMGQGIQRDEAGQATDTAQAVVMKVASVATAVCDQCLDLALFIDAKHQSALRRVKIEANDVTHLLNELRISRELESLAAMRSQRGRTSEKNSSRHATAIFYTGERRAPTTSRTGAFGAAVSPFRASCPA